ncbi:uncharacterized protein Y057_14277 [Fusarium fujikuroi]|nr:uncharacterized protein Y057_14277 [Fusarium fujikuroi]
MLLEGAHYSLQLGLLLSLSLITTAQPEPVLSSILQARDTDKPFSGGPIDTTYLPAQIGGIIGAYAVSLVLVAITLLALSKKRREHIAAGIDEVDFEVRKDIVSPDFPPTAVPTSLNIITDTEFIKPSFQDSHEGNPYIYPSPASSVGAPGTNPFVDPRVVAVDRLMAQSQLEDMYKHVLEHEDAKKRGVVYDVPLPPNAHHQPRPSASASVLSLKSSTSSPSKKERSKPATLNLSASREEKSQSRTSSFLSALRSPKKKQMKGMSISSPLMTPQSGEFPRYEGQEMSAIPPRHYAPAAPPPVPTNQVPFPSLPASPKPGQTFHRANAPSAVRTGGSLPLRAYEPAMVSPNTIAQTTKQTVFERKGPLSPSGAMTPHTAGAVPYSPYQPFTPCMPVTPSLVTREDRKRMKRMVPKTPTLEMVQSSDDVW